MTVTGTVGEWEGWTGMRFPESGPYVVPGALCPVRMDLERDLGTYEEPNVWMRHPIEAEGYLVPAPRAVPSAVDRDQRTHTWTSL